MHQVFRDSATDRLQSNRNDSVQAFFFDRTHKPFCVSVAVRRAWRTKYGFDAFSTQERFEMRSEFIVTVHDQVSVRSQRPVEFVRELPRHLNHKRSIRVRGDAGDVDPTCCQVNREQ